MIPEFFQYPEAASHVSLWKTFIGVLIVLFAIFVGVEIRLDKDDEEQ